MRHSIYHLHDLLSSFLFALFTTYEGREERVRRGREREEKERKREREGG